MARTVYLSTTGKTSLGSYDQEKSDSWKVIDKGPDWMFPRARQAVFGGPNFLGVQPMLEP
jgi:hypothetical protein